MMPLTKEEKLLRVQKALRENLSFLQHYLALANSHSKDFITHKHWDTFLPEKIREKLLSLSDQDLISLPYEKVKTNEDRISEDVGKTEWKFHCDYFIHSPQVGKKYNIYSEEMKSFPPTWVHKDVRSFVVEAQQHMLDRSGVLSTLEDLAGRLNYSGERKEAFISQYMDKKKSHEVEVMGEIVAGLAKSCDTDLIIDMGSGKGYLSAHLALQHRLTVLGVDAQTTNTSGASKRATVLNKQWKGLTRNAKLREETEDGRKLGKKLKKKMRKLEEEKEKGEFRDEASSQEHDNQQKEGISDDVLMTFGDLFVESEGDDKNENNENSRITSDSGLSFYELSNLEDSTSKYHNKKSQIEDAGKQNCKQCNSESGMTDENTASDIAHSKCVKLHSSTPSSKQGNGRTETPSGVNDGILSTDKRTTNQCHFPVTLFVDDDTDMIQVVKETFTAADHNPEKDISNDTILMVTGLHTCGMLGSSTLRLFVSCQQATVLCNVGCCYHLMNEEFVANPYREGESDDSSGFPLSNFLLDHRVGLGKLARSFASQSVSRRGLDSELVAKQFPRTLLQAVLHDILGYTSEAWKGLRKLDQKSKNMQDYIQKAVKKLGLPQEQFSPDRVQSCIDKYSVYERRFMAYFQLKLVLAPCIEAIVLLDRLCYLLEQNCVEDAMLIQLFDPVKSPRCYGIVAFKNKEES